MNKTKIKVLGYRNLVLAAVTTTDENTTYTVVKKRAEEQTISTDMHARLVLARFYYPDRPAYYYVDLQPNNQSWNILCSKNGKVVKEQWAAVVNGVATVELDFGEDDWIKFEVTALPASLAEAQAT
jgi:hypothetical protein